MRKRYNKKAVERLRQRIKDKDSPPPMDRTKRPMSGLEEQVAEILDTLGIEWEREVPLKFQHQWRYFDFRLTGYNVLLEVDGAYYHDKRDKPSYVIMMAKRNDYLKNWIAKKEGYELIRIKEQQLKEEYNAVVQNISLAVGKEGEQEDE